MTRAQLKAINDRLDAEDEEFDELVVQEARAKLSPAELARIEAEVDADDSDADDDSDDDLDLDDDDLVDDDGIEAEEDIAAPAVVMGLGADGVFRHTADQLRSPEWCRSTQADRAKATSFELVP